MCCQVKHYSLKESKMEPRERVELSPHPYQGRVLPLNYGGGIPSGLFDIGGCPSKYWKSHIPTTVIVAPRKAIQSMWGRDIIHN